MSELLRELYQESIIDHSRNPRCFGKLESYTHSKASYNPLCGDRVTLYAHKNSEGLVQLSFEGSGCAMCIASASLLLELFNSLSIEESKALMPQLFQILSADAVPQDLPKVLGKLIVLQGVKNYPSRVKCVTLSWHALKEILETIRGESR